VFLDTNSIKNKVKVVFGDGEKIADRDAYSYLFTYGENPSDSDCLVPMECYFWHSTHTQVVLEWWDTRWVSPSNDALTTLAKRQHTGKSVEWQGKVWRWSKHYEFLHFIDLPHRTALPLKTAVSAISNKKISQLIKGDWRIRPTSDLKNPSECHQYEGESAEEFTVAREQYVKPRSGWFSDRNVWYLAAGRLLPKKLCFSKFIPNGEGLFAFSNPEEAVEAINRIAGD
jgi:hypothetical protein